MSKQGITMTVLIISTITADRAVLQCYLNYNITRQAPKKQ